MERDDTFADNDSIIQEDNSQISDLKKEILDKIQLKCTPSPSQIQKLKSLNIKVGVQDKHNLSLGIETSDVPKENVKTSSYTKEELTIIEDNWTNFCSVYGFDAINDVILFVPSPFWKKNMKLNSNQKKLFCLYMAQGLPNRNPISVYNRFVNLLYYTKQGQWSSQEDELLLSVHNLMGSKLLFTIVGAFLRRKRFCCYRRLSILQQNEQKSAEADAWENISQWKDKSVDEYPEWTKNEDIWDRISSKNNINKIELKSSFYFDVHPSTKCSSRSCNTSELNRQIVKRLKEIDPTTWDDVDWIELGHSNYNIGAVKAYKIVRELTKRYVPKEIWNDLSEVIKVLNEETLSG